MAGSGAGKSSLLTALVQAAIVTGISLDVLADLDFADLDVVHQLAEQEQQRRAWTNDTELLAGILDQLRNLTAVVQAGIPTVQVKRLRPAKQPKPVKRPEWLKRVEAAVIRPGEFFRMMKKG